MKKGLTIFLFFAFIFIPQNMRAQDEEFISYKVDDLEFYLTDIKLEYHPDEDYVHIEGTKILKADMGEGRMPRYQNCERGITIECFKKSESYIGTIEAYSSDVMPVYVSWCLVLQADEKSRKEIKNFLASFDSGEEGMNFSITFEEFGPAGSFVKGTFYGKLLDEEGKLHHIKEGKFKITRTDAE